MMNRIKSCIECIYDKQKQISRDEAYLKEIKKIIDSRDENDKPPYLVYLFNQVYEKHFGERPSFKEIKKQYNNLLSSISRKVFDDADVILSKGQGNYECLYGLGFHIFYSFLCKCDHFTNTFKVPKFTGIFTEEK